MIDVSGRTGSRSLSKSVGNQYAEASVRGPHRAAAGSWRSDAGVENASVSRLPTNVWPCERPGWRGKTIGSSLLRWVDEHATTKYGPPGKPVTRGRGYGAPSASCAAAATPSAASSALATTANRRRAIRPKHGVRRRRVQAVSAFSQDRAAAAPRDARRPPRRRIQRRRVLLE